MEYGHLIKMIKFIIEILFFGHIHKWSKWEQFTIEAVHILSGIDVIQQRQKRTCQKCNKVEEECV
jgi:hypothetical protein